MVEQSRRTRRRRQCRQRNFSTFQSKDPSAPMGKKPVKALIGTRNPPICNRKNFTRKRQGWVTELKMKVAFSPLGVYDTRSFRSPEFFQILCKFLRSKLPDVTNGHVSHWIELHPWITEEVHFQPPKGVVRATSKVPVQTPAGNPSRKAKEKETVVESSRPVPDLPEILDDILDLEASSAVADVATESSYDEGPPFLLREDNIHLQQPSHGDLGTGITDGPIGQLDETAPSPIPRQGKNGEQIQTLPTGNPRIHPCRIQEEEESMDSCSNFDANEIGDIRAFTPPPAEYIYTWLQNSSFGQKLDEFAELEGIYDLARHVHARSAKIPSVKESALDLFAKTVEAMERLILPVSYEECLQARLTQLKVEQRSV